MREYGPTREIRPQDLADPFGNVYPRLTRGVTKSAHQFERYTIEQILQAVSTSAVRLSISSLLNFEPIDIYPSNGFLVFTQKGAEEFQVGTFRRQYLTSKGDPRDAAAIVTFGCPVGKWAPYVPYKTRAGKKVRGSCAAPMEIHQVLIPWSKVEAGISAATSLAAAPRKSRGRKAVANPLLLTVQNPRRHKIPRAIRNAAPVFPYATTGVGNAPRKRLKPSKSQKKLATLKIPFKKGQVIPRKEYEAWMEKFGDEKLKKDYRETMVSYHEFHEVYPSAIVYEELELGGSKRLPVEVLYAAGRSNTETYTPEKSSGKAPHSYFHDYKDKPFTLINARGSLVIKPLRGRARVGKLPSEKVAWFLD